MQITDTKKNLAVRPEAWVCLFLVLSTLVVYLQVGKFDFQNYDTEKYVYENKIVKAGLTAKGIKWAFTTIYFSNWHPLTWLSHMLDVQLYGLHPGRHHMISAFLHIVNTLLLFGILRRMTGALWQSSFVAALFALHPLHVESVVWVAERKDVLSTLFGLLVLWSYASYVQNPGVSRYVFVILFFILGLMAKPMLVTLPFLLILLDYWPLQRVHFKKVNKIDPSGKEGSTIWFLVVEKFPLFIVAAASCVVTYYAQRAGGSIASMDACPLSFRISNALISYVSYIAKMIWPAKLAIFYPYGKMVPAWQVWTACCLIMGISLLSVKYFRLRPWFPVGWLWFLGTLTPVIGVVQIGAQSMADRYTYVPIIGLFIIIAWGLFEFLARWSYQNLRFALIAAAASGVLMVVTWNQVRYWRTSVALFKHTIEVTENNYLAHNNLGQGLLLQGKTAEAVDHFKQSLKINENYGLAHFNMGVALFNQKRFEEALEYFMNAEQIMPDNARVYYSLGKTLYRLDKLDKAVENLQQAIKIDPDYAEAYNDLGEALSGLEKYEKAVASFEQAIAINATYARAYYNYGNLWYHTGNLEYAMQNFIKAIKIDPAFAEAYNSAGAVLIKRGEVRKAAALFREALRIDPGYVAAQNNLNKTLAALNKNN